jgi:uncharacterized protein YecE (DUF72 family)
MPQIRVGTMGFSYREWVGPFYPRGTRPDDYLKRYSEVFDTVELDTTFYGIPRAWTVRTWARETPPDFRFTLKLPRSITHEKGLEGATEELLAFVKAVEPLGEKLSALLIQMPPSFRPDRREALMGFLRELPRDVPFALELRDPDWMTSETADALRELGICWVGVDMPGMPRTIPTTSQLTYLRLLGDHKQIVSKDRVVMDREDELEKWARALEEIAFRGLSCLVFVNNHYTGHSPTTVNRLKDLLGLPQRHPAGALQIELF